MPSFVRLAVERPDGMKRVARICAAALLVLAVAPVLAFVTYDALVFHPHLAEMRAILARADPEDRDPPTRIRRYVRAAHRDGAPPSATVARNLLVQFESPLHGGMMAWHLRYALWDRLVALHLSDDETFGLYAALAYDGRGHGLTAMSRRLFAKPLGALSEREAATVVACSRMPATSARDPERLERVRDVLLSRARNVH